MPGDEQLLAFGQVGAAGEQPFQFGCANGFGSLRQGGDRGNGGARTIPLPKTADALLDDLFDLGDRVASDFELLIDDRFQAVDIDQRDVGNLGDGWVGVARDGDVDDEHRAVWTPGHRFAHPGRIQNEVRGAGRGDDQVGGGERIDETGELDGFADSGVDRRFARAGDRAIGHDHARRAFQTQTHALTPTVLRAQQASAVGLGVLRSCFLGGVES